MTDQTIFKRYELKYLLTPEQLKEVQAAMRHHMMPDRFFTSTVRSVYFDTDSYRLIRHSIEQPVYKEKLRLRSYVQADADSPVFVELKKKYQSVVYKRRIELPLGEAEDWILRGRLPEHEDRLSAGEQQIMHEIGYFLDYYQTLAPAALITCDRKAYMSSEQADLRITFDSSILARAYDMSLGGEIGGRALLPDGKTLMEVKTAGGMPLWLSDVLGRCHIYRSAYSKYGTAYQTILYPAARGTEWRTGQKKGEKKYA